MTGTSRRLAAVALLLAGVILPAPVRAVSLDEVDWASPAFQALHPTAAKAVEQARRNRAIRQRDVLAPELKKWNEELALRERTRNVKGMAIARAAVEAITKSMETLVATGTAPAPETARTELVPAMAKLKAQLETAQRAPEPSLGPVLADFKRALEAAGVANPAEADLLAAFQRWAAAPAPPVAPVTPPASDGSPAQTGTTAADTPAAGAAPAALQGPYFAQSAAAAGWKKLGRWTARISAMDILEVKLFDQEGKTRGKTENPLFGTAVAWEAEFSEKLPPGRYHFRLKRIPEHLTVDVEQWPNERNNGILEIRTPQPELKDQAVGFEIEYAGTEPLIAVSIETEPAGAQIEVDGAVYMDDGKPFRAPGVIHLPAGGHAIRIFAEGHVEQKVDRYVVREGAAIQARLAPITARTAPGRLVRVDAKVIWAQTGITVAAGSKITVVTSGEWACGAKKEMCSSAGYPAGDSKFGHYYLNPRNSPRQVNDAPYGALIARIGTGLPFVVRSGQEWVAREAGQLQFDINEAADPKLRADNQGIQEARVQITPPGK